MTFLQRAEESFPGNGQRILDVIRNVTDIESFRSVEKWLSQGHGRPKRVDLKMCAINEIIDGSGVVAIFADCEVWPDMMYVNMGDTYTTTVYYDYLDNVFRVGDYGSWIEDAATRGRTYP